MVEAFLGLLIGGALARHVLWPIEMSLARRHVRRLARRTARLAADLHSDT